MARPLSVLFVASECAHFVKAGGLGDVASALPVALRAMGHDGSHANAGGQVAVAFNLRGRDGGSMPECDDLASIRAASGGSSRSYVSGGMAVRRLTPVEAERLQGVPENFTLVPYRGRPMADSSRYKMLGNGFAIPVLAWIARRIEEALEAGKRMVL